MAAGTLSAAVVAAGRGGGLSRHAFSSSSCRGSACIGPRSREVPPLAWKLKEDLLLSPRVAGAEVRGGVAYVVWASRPWHSKLPFLHGSDEAALRRHLVDSCGHAPQAVPVICPVLELPSPDDDDDSSPFMLQHILSALFQELDANGDGTVSMKEFLDFSRRHSLFDASDEELRGIFLDADRQTFEAFGARRLDEGEFKQLVLDTGLVEIRGRAVGSTAARYFLSDRIVDVILRHWLAKYDSDGDGAIDLAEYCRLVASHRLPFAVSAEAFRRLDKNGDGALDIAEFKDLLRQAKVLSTGAAIAKADDAEGLKAAWRAMEPSQQFLPSSRVHAAIAGEDLPPRPPGALRFVCVSDTHGEHEALTGRLPEGDVLLHAGDVSMCGEPRELRAFGRWLSSLPYARKVFVAGNHDLTLDRHYAGHDTPAIADAALAALQSACDGSVVFLQDGEHSVSGVRIYGSPWQPAFGSWAFNLPRGRPLREKWRAIPEGVDVVLVHGPPLGRGDRLAGSERRVGCADLLAELQGRVRPAFCVFGHLHEGWGVSFDGTTHYVNASSLDHHYAPTNAPLVFDIQVPEQP